MLCKEDRLTGYPGVGGRELGADDCLICLCCLLLGFEELGFLGLLRIVGAGLVSLAEEITDELLGAFIKVVEVLWYI